MGYAELDDLFGNGVAPTEDLELPGGQLVTVRGLTRYELLLNARDVGDSLTLERRNLATCMVRPTLTEDQVEQWQKSSPPNVIGSVTDLIRRLSGLAEGAAKSDVPRDGADGP